MNEPIERTLTVVNYGVDEEGVPFTNRITMAPGGIEFVISTNNMITTADGIEIRKVNVVMSSGSNLELYLTDLDLSTIERAVGAYFLP